MIEPEGPFLEMFAGVWEPLLGPELDAGAFRRSFSRDGSYTIPLPGLKGHRVVVLNSVFFSVNYANVCGRSTQTRLPWINSAGWPKRSKKLKTLGNRSGC